VLARRTRGFTLIEVMITVAIVGILAAIAYPSYRDSLIKSRRADAKAVLLEAAQWMERFYTENARYDQDRAGDAVALPAALSAAPKEGSTKYYAITLVDADLARTTFTLQAAPNSNGGQDADPCGTLTLTNTGARGVLGEGASADRCW
jgi:type IV pilus assembly protein PilE